MAILVTPEFYEINFSDVSSGKTRLIENRFIYIINEFDSDGRPKKYWEFFTSSEGKLRIWDFKKKAWKLAPIYPGIYHFCVTDSNSPISSPHLNLNKGMCSRPITVTKQKDQHIEIPYKEGDLYFAIYYEVSDGAFKKAADTWRKEKGLRDECTKTSCFISKQVRTEPQFKKAWEEIYSRAVDGHYKVIEGRLFTHASINHQREGLEFASDPSDPMADQPHQGEATLEAVEISQLEKLPWDKKGLLGLHGCNTGVERNGWSPAQVFSVSQCVSTSGQMGFAVFSEKKDTFDRFEGRFDLFDDPVYLQAYKRKDNVGPGEQSTDRLIPEKTYYYPPR